MTGYIMESAEEGQRVERKTDRALTVEQLRWGGVEAGARVLDLGCAAGTTCRIMADLVGERGRVVGVDASGERLDEARGHPDHRRLIEYRRGDAERMPCEDGEFDVAWSRFVFEYLPDPRAALREMTRVARPGGTIVVSDLDGNGIWHEPIDPALGSMIDEARATLGVGFDPHAGRALFGMFVDAGLADVAVDVRPYHVLAGAIDEARAALWEAKLRGVSGALRSRGWGDDQAHEFQRRFLEHLRDPRTLTYSVLFTVRGARAG